jgi:hypothetical protein
MKLLLSVAYVFLKALMEVRLSLVWHHVWSTRYPVLLPSPALNRIHYMAD